MSHQSLKAEGEVFTLCCVIQNSALDGLLSIMYGSHWHRMWRDVKHYNGGKSSLWFIIYPRPTVCSSGPPGVRKSLPGWAQQKPDYKGPISHVGYRLHAVVHRAESLQSHLVPDDIWNAVWPSECELWLNYIELDVSGCWSFRNWSLIAV